MICEENKDFHDFTGVFFVYGFLSPGSGSDLDYQITEIKRHLDNGTEDKKGHFTFLRTF